MSSVPWQIDRHFIGAGKALVANVITGGQVIGSYDNDTKALPRIEVGFEIGEQTDIRSLQNLSGTWYMSDFSGSLDITVCTAHSDTQHANYVGEVLRLFACDAASIEASVANYYEVKSIMLSSSELDRDDAEDEMRRMLRYRVAFSVKPW